MYVPIRLAAKHYSVSDQTIRAWGEKGKLEFISLPSGQKRYRIRGHGNVDVQPDTPKEKEKVNVCYCRVSSSGQKEDLLRQIQYMQNKYPGWVIYTDIGSGLNWKRKGLKTLLQRCMLGDVQKVAVAHKDRLARFGYELIEYIMAQCGVQLLCDHENDHKSKESELVQDILSIVTVFSARIHGSRHYNNKDPKTDSVPKKRGREEVNDVDGVL
jgi:predicted site-specific integrase-resolvase